MMLKSLTAHSKCREKRNRYITQHKMNRYLGKKGKPPRYRNILVCSLLFQYQNETKLLTIKEQSLQH